jgi:DNA invertase Pin-like site-specific DNA recombinase
MKYGYARVSPGGKSESIDAQARQLTKAGCKKVFRDVHVSGAKTDRARTAEGRERAKGRGVKKGRKPKLTPHQQREAIKRRDVDGEPIRDIARTYNVHNSTISRLAA